MNADGNVVAVADDEGDEHQKKSYQTVLVMQPAYLRKTRSPVVGAEVGNDILLQAQQIRDPNITFKVLARHVNKEYGTQSTRKVRMLPWIAVGNDNSKCTGECGAIVQKTQPAAEKNQPREFYKCKRVTCMSPLFCYMHLRTKIHLKFQPTVGQQFISRGTGLFAYNPAAGAGPVHEAGHILIKNIPWEAGITEAPNPHDQPYDSSAGPQWISNLISDVVHGIPGKYNNADPADIRKRQQKIGMALYILSQIRFVPPAAHATFPGTEPNAYLRKVDDYTPQPPADGDNENNEECVLQIVCITNIMHGEEVRIRDSTLLDGDKEPQEFRVRTKTKFQGQAQGGGEDELDLLWIPGRVRSNGHWENNPAGPTPLSAADDAPAPPN